MTEYLPRSEGEQGHDERTLKRYKTLGHEGSADHEKSGQGIVAVSYLDPRVASAPIVIFEIHKLRRTDTDLRAHWVVQVQSVGGKRQTLTRHGCVAAGSALFALAKAEADVQAGFVARDTFDMAANAYWLKL
ncbi:hypothetical protein [Pseudorhodoplanes sp.]|uniref:hypothetical protein n=1 Tax=Pseudorhodoplanes sp. TaxID=1934341 RepID=UPI003D0C5747